mmetsp:Transcript_99002/g.148305  ORF Transcript_99002/g.148305 Transcript_99002/m.148305 type:complete len:84 (-) Transcript_99002:235-486(-)
MSKRGRSGQVGVKMKVTNAFNTFSTLNCADNTGAKNLHIFSVFGIRGHLDRLPRASLGDMFLCSVRKGKADLRKKVLYGVVIR